MSRLLSNSIPFGDVVRTSSWFSGKKRKNYIMVVGRFVVSAMTNMNMI